MENLIRITGGVGSGPTPLGALDAALFAAGVANHNLIHLSSVIPPGKKPVIKQVHLNESTKEYGRRLYAVYAEKTETEQGKSAWAGLGWTLTKGEPRRGLFVEHTGEDKEAVVQQIKLTLKHMVSYRKEKYGVVRHKETGISCTGDPVCAIVLAVYETVPWE